MTITVFWDIHRVVWYVLTDFSEVITACISMFSLLAKPRQPQDGGITAKFEEVPFGIKVTHTHTSSPMSLHLVKS
jgi:hypothetical protein